MMRIVFSDKLSITQTETFDEGQCFKTFRNREDIFGLEEPEVLAALRDKDSVSLFAWVQYLLPRTRRQVDPLTQEVMRDDEMQLEEFLHKYGGWKYCPRQIYDEIVLERDGGKSVLRALRTSAPNRPEHVTLSKIYKYQTSENRSGHSDKDFISAGLAVLMNGNVWREYGRRVAISRAIMRMPDDVKDMVGLDRRQRVNSLSLNSAVVGGERVYAVAI